MYDRRTTGETLSHFRILGRLGQGGMGEVWRAEDLRLGRQVAIKLLHPALVGDGGRMARLEREARALAAISHPSIVTIYSIEEAEGRTFLAMELVEGEPLDEWAGPEGLPTTAFLALAESLVAAVAAAHERGVVHRDLKPGNVLVTPTGAVKVLDFGLAKLAEPRSGERGREERLTREGVVVGTMEYMAPEQAEGGEIDARTDVFALGILLYQLATGRHPFARPTAMATLSAIMAAEPPRAGAVRAGLPPALEAVLHRCLAKDPAARFADAGALLAALRAAGAEAAAPTVDRVPARGDRPVRRPLAWLVAAVVVALVAGWGLWRGIARSGDGSAVTEAPAPAPVRVAVLPFADLSGEPDRAHLVDGLTEAVITDLARLSGLRVIARTSVMRYGSGNPEPRAVARELDADFLVTGAVIQADERLRVTAQLLAAGDDAPLWAERYDEPASGLVDLQGRLVRGLAREMEVRLAPAEARRLATAVAGDPAAYELYLEGRHLAAGRTAEGLAAAAARFEAAIARDPRLALAWSGLADAWLLLAQYYVESPLAAMPRAKTAAERALAIDPGLPEARTSLAAVRSTFDWDWRGAEGEYRRAIAAGPSYAIAHTWLAEHLSILGRHDEALAAVRVARRLDPHSAIVRYQEAEVLYFARRFPEALRVLDAALATDPDEWLFQYALGFGLAESGDAAAGLAAMTRAVRLSGGAVWARAGRVAHPRPRRPRPRGPRPGPRPRERGRHRAGAGRHGLGRRRRDRPCPRLARARPPAPRSLDRHRRRRPRLRPPPRRSPLLRRPPHHRPRSGVRGRGVASGMAGRF